MPTIGEFAYGYDTEGVTTYLDNIKSESLDKAKAAVEDISAIQQVCENEWEGKARENFITNLQKDANHVGDQFDALYNVLVNEINSLNAAMANKDEELIQVD
jgi:uncharacterized protein YukE